MSQMRSVRSFDEDLGKDVQLTNPTGEGDDGGEGEDGGGIEGGSNQGGRKCKDSSIQETFQDCTRY